MRNELSTLYRTQAAAQNKQLAMADALRDRDEEVRGLREEVRELRDARDAGARRERNWEERWRMRDEDVKVGCALQVAEGGVEVYICLAQRIQPLKGLYLGRPSQSCLSGISVCTSDRHSRHEPRL